MSSVSRFAPSSTGRAHPGTLLAGLLCWLDARSRGGRVVLRVEDLDPDRSSPALVRGLVDDLAWLGLDWDRIETQSDADARHRLAVDRLRGDGRLYPCTCSRREIEATAPPAIDGGRVYPGTCRSRSEAPAGEHAWRFRLDASPIVVEEEGGSNHVAVPGSDVGDPIVVRRDGAVAYHLASVVDDAAAGVDRVVRGRDLAGTTGVQVALRRALGLAVPTYRHHLLLLEEHGGKLAKLHGSVGCPELRAHLDAESVCGFLAWVAGLATAPRRCRPRDLVDGFDWSRVACDDQVVAWDGRTLLWQGSGKATVSGLSRT